MPASSRVVPLTPITNEQFLRAVFGERWGEALVAYFHGDPGGSPDWRTYPAASVLRVMSPELNNYWDVSLPQPGGGRSGNDFAALYAVVFDDWGVKVDPVRAEAVMGCLPSYILETSPGNHQAGWFIDPLTDRAWVSGLLRALYEALGRKGDNLVKPTTLVRLPCGSNLKAALGQAGFRVRLVHWQPDSRVRHTDWIEIERRVGEVVPVELRLGVGNAMPDPAAIEADPILRVFRERGMVQSAGRAMTFGWGFEVECPWAGEHIDPRTAAAYVPVAQRYKCHHGHCEDRGMADVRAWADGVIREDSGGLLCLASLEFDAVDPARLARVHPGPLSGEAIDLWTRLAPPAWPGSVGPARLEDSMGDLAARDGVDLGALGAVMLTAASGAADKRILLTPYANTLWDVRPVLWTMLVAETGLRKTALLRHPLASLRRQNLERMKQYGRDAALWQALPKADRQQQHAPTVRALLAEDTTIEKLQEWMAANPRGLLYLRDELAGLFDFGRYSGGGHGAAERAFFLETYEGGPMTIGRMTRTTTIDNCALAMLGGIQPQKLASFTGLDEDGLLSRLGIVLQQPVSSQGRRAAGTPEIGAILAIIDQLLAIGAFESYRTDPAGEGHIRETESAGEDLLLRPDIGVGLRGFIRKLHGVHARTALILHLIDGGQDQVIPEATVARAGRYARFLLGHAEVFYAGLPGSADHTAQAIGSFLLRHPMPRVTAGQLRRDIAACRSLRSLKEVQDAVFLLTIGGWLQPETHYPSNYAWQVRPGLQDQFAARRASETVRAELVKQAMNRLGQYR
jgi:hypothetical protein